MRRCWEYILLGKCLPILKHLLLKPCWGRCLRTLELHCESTKHLNAPCTDILWKYTLLLLKQHGKCSHNRCKSLPFFSVHQEFKLASLNTQPSPKCFSRVCLSCKTRGMSFGLFCRENQAKVHLNNSQQNDSRGKS